jgi:hypothetical protein
MAQKVNVVLVDDLDGHPGDDVTTVQFGLDGVTYEIELSDVNAERLREPLATYVNAARRTGGRKSRATRPAPNPLHSLKGSVKASDVREWANNNGENLAPRGRIPGYVMDRYRAAMAEEKAAAAGPASSAKAPVASFSDGGAAPAAPKRRTRVKKA